MRREAFSFVLLVLFVNEPASVAAPVPCSPAKATRAEDTSDSLRTWDAVHHWQKLYSACNDADAGEGVSESVARILVDHWAALPRLMTIIKVDHSFKNFVLDGINATLSIDDVKTIKDNSRHQCPANARSLCQAMFDRANEALDEDASLGIR